MRILMGVVLAHLCVASAARGQGCDATWVGGTNIGPVFAVARMPDGDLVLGGNFTMAGGQAAGKVARFTPATGKFSPLGASGAGVNGSVAAVVVLPDGDVLIGGQFTMAGGSAASNIARYRPSTGAWIPVAPGTNRKVNVMLVLADGSVVVGGEFDRVGAMSANFVARYDPATSVWSRMGDGVAGRVTALAPLPGGEVAVGGGFLQVGLRPIRAVARYNLADGQWRTMGSGVAQTGPTAFNFPQGTAMDVLADGRVVVGGVFNVAGGMPARNVAIYDPSTDNWSAPPTGPDGPVYLVRSLPDGTALASGQFYDAGSALGVVGQARLNIATAAWSWSGTSVGVISAAIGLPTGDQIISGWEVGRWNPASYRFQRSVEARIRLMDSAGRHEFPDEPRELEKLAFLLGYADVDRLVQEVDQTWRDTRERFERIFNEAAAE
ncbi:MAG: hypothetical protein K2Q20_02425 [Phycisphaerales bacterium]|nr:hypothetical protein [Phycisphaerales bacterium]